MEVLEFCFTEPLRFIGKFNIDMMKKFVLFFQAEVCGNKTKFFLYSAKNNCCNSPYLFDLWIVIH